MATSAAVEILRTCMCGFACVLLIIAWMDEHRVEKDIGGTMQFFIKVLAVVVTIAYAHTIMFKGTALLNEAAGDAQEKTALFMDNMNEVEPEGYDSKLSIVAPIVSHGLKFSHVIATLTRELITLGQWMFLSLMYALSPVMLAMLVYGPTQRIGIKFLTTTFGIMLWGFGIIMADLMFIALWDRVAERYIVTAIDQTVTQSAMVQGFTDATLSVGMVVFLASSMIILALLYWLTPLLIMVILSGGSPAQVIGRATQLGATLATGRAAGVARQVTNAGGMMTAGAAGAAGAKAAGVAAAPVRAGAAVARAVTSQVGGLNVPSKPLRSTDGDSATARRHRFSPVPISEVRQFQQQQQQMNNERKS